MISEVTISVQARPTTGSSESRRSRRDGHIPVSIYGAKQTPYSGTVNAKEFNAFLRTGVSRATVFAVNVPEQGATQVVVKDIQIHPVTGKIQHLDLIRVDANTPAAIRIPVRLVGEPAGVKQGAVLQKGVRDLRLSCIPTSMPSEITVNVKNLGIGERIQASQVELPEGVKLLSAGNQLIAALVGTRQSTQAAQAEATETKKGKK
jgi:large subunit ribosomal protein L25